MTAVVALLEKVYPDGRSVYVTDASLRASHRALTTPPYDNIGLPYHAIDKTLMDATAKFNEGIATLSFALPSAGIVFEKGTRLRLAITGADKDNVVQRELNPPPTVTLYSGKGKLSKLSLPMVKSGTALKRYSGT